MDRAEIRTWLVEDDPARLETLWRRADEVRRRAVGDAVHLRGLVEFSNHCRRGCAYCGLRSPHAALERYRMEAAEILACVRLAVELGYGTVVLQSGEDPGLDPEWLAGVVRAIKREAPAVAVTLSVGERDEDELALWRSAGADRYFMRFETSNRELFHAIHPPRPGGRAIDRLELVRALERIGYEVGSGIMIGIPGQSYDDLACDIELFRTLDLDMIGVGPYLPNPETPLGADGEAFALPEGEQVPNTDGMTYKVLALTRITCPDVNLPSTTALSIARPDGGRERGLARGANVVMPNLTPAPYRVQYAIYPGRTASIVDPRVFDRILRASLSALGRSVGAGRGDSPHRLRRAGPAVSTRL